ncbi:hypothetical protein GGR56DRAFT_671787 [Xylariaceae sp. FL0804]|nr:hypothetical protein GGR56DRAFT_671787 [Xylariaceae sp. FL0804]
MARLSHSTSLPMTALCLSVAWQLGLFLAGTAAVLSLLPPPLLEPPPDRNVEEDAPYAAAEQYPGGAAEKGNHRRADVLLLPCLAAAMGLLGAVFHPMVYALVRRAERQQQAAPAWSAHVNTHAQAHARPRQCAAYVRMVVLYCVTLLAFANVDGALAAWAATGGGGREEGPDPAGSEVICVVASLAVLVLATAAAVELISLLGLGLQDPNPYRYR